MTDERIIKCIADNIYTLKEKGEDYTKLAKTHHIIIGKDGIRFEPKGATPLYKLKKQKEVALDIPVLFDAGDLAVAQIALAVGRRLERFERGRKANAGRDATSRQKIAQNAIQSRWSAK